jgi:murein DD-endopeptidase MepM/ murein hydrolase activator NlpD
MIDHGGGWHTGYYHLTDIRVSAGQPVKRGTVLGKASTATGCGGTPGPEPHVHFNLWKFSGAFNFSDAQQYSLDGVSLGGWTVQEGATARSGCMIRFATVHSGGVPTKKCRGEEIDGRVVPVSVLTRDGKGNNKTVFAPGDAIQYATVLLNPASTKPTLRISFRAWLAGGQEPPIFDGAGSATIPPGVVGLYAPSTIPPNAPPGQYYLVATVEDHYAAGAAEFTVGR